MECSIKDIYEIAGYDFDWKVVGRRLVGDQKVEDIDREGTSERDKRDKMLLEWKKTKSRDATYQALVDVLRSIQNNATADLVEKLEKKRRSSQDSISLSLHRLLSPKTVIAILVLLGAISFCFINEENALTTSLKQRYCNLMRAEDDFPPVLTLSFTNLTLINDTTEMKRSPFFWSTIKGSVDYAIERKVSVAYKDLLDGLNDSKNRVLLLEGRPGCGKTTLTRQISNDWCKGVILRFVKYLFLIPLRQFYRTPIELSIILKHFDSSELETDITKNKGKGVCFIFDGLDEYSHNYAKDGQSWFERLLKGSVLSSSIIIITSRPNASVELRKSVHIRGEVLGFVKEQIDEYIDKFYSNNQSKAIEVKEYLHKHQNIQHMCYIPLHLVMMMQVYDECQERGIPLPITETDVYYSFTRMTLLRYLKKKTGNYPKLNDLQSLPSPVSTKFLNISRLAFNATAASMTSISMDDLSKTFSISDIEDLGFIVMDQKVSSTGKDSVLSFVHLTIQEFLAAYYLSTLPSYQQLKAIKMYFHQSHMSVVQKFFCGITKLKNIDHWTALVDEYSYGTLDSLHCAFESQNRQRCRDLFSKFDGQLRFVNETHTPLDYFAAGYCLGSADDTVKSIALECELSAEGLDIVRNTITRSMESVQKLQIHDDLCDKDKLLALKELLHRLPNMKFIDLSACFEKEECSYWTLLGDLVKETTHLQTLVLNGNVLTPNGMKALLAARGSLSNLRVLGMRYCFRKGWNEWTLLRDLLKETPCLESLFIDYNYIGLNGMKVLSARIASLSNLIELSLFSSSLRDDSIPYLIEIIKKCPLKFLVVGNFHDDRWNFYDSEIQNKFSEHGIESLKEQAMSIRPGMKLVMDKWDLDDFDNVMIDFDAEDDRYPQCLTCTENRLTHTAKSPR